MSQVMVAGDISSPWSFFFAPGLGLAAIAWSILAVTLALRTDSMERDSAVRPHPSDDELRKQYEALRAARIEENGFQARRSLVREFLLLVLAGGLFLGHWRWLRRRGDDPAAAV